MTWQQAATLSIRARLHVCQPWAQLANHVAGRPADDSNVNTWPVAKIFCNRPVRGMAMSDSGNVVFSGNSGDWNVNTGSGTQNIHVSKDSREATLEQVDQLVARLLAGIAELPPGNAAVVAGEVVAVKNEAHAASPDRGRVGHALGRLAEAAAPVAGMIELSRQLADLVGQLVH
jgi:hypothetical protein